jgi:hypothetical protein
VLRLLALVATLGLIGVGVVIVTVVRDLRGEAAKFDAQRFKDAAERDDVDAMEDEAYDAHEQRALVGLSRAQVRQRLGKPQRIGGRRHVYVWDLGLINDFMGPGDQGRFTVQFDTSWRRVIDARVEG